MRSQRGLSMHGVLWLRNSSQIRGDLGARQANRGRCEPPSLTNCHTDQKANFCHTNSATGLDDPAPRPRRRRSRDGSRSRVPLRERIFRRCCDCLFCVLAPASGLVLLHENIRLSIALAFAPTARGQPTESSDGLIDARRPAHRAFRAASSAARRRYVR